MPIISLIVHLGMFPWDLWMSYLVFWSWESHSGSVSLRYNCPSSLVFSEAFKLVRNINPWHYKSKLLLMSQSKYSLTLLIVSPGNLGSRRDRGNWWRSFMYESLQGRDLSLSRLCSQNKPVFNRLCSWDWFAGWLTGWIWPGPPRQP